MAKGEPLTTAERRQAYDMRGRGLTYDQIGRALGISAAAAWQAIQRYGADPMPPRVHPAHMTIADMCERWGSVHVEEAAGGGYIAWVGNTSSDARETVQGALKSAAARAMWEEQLDIEEELI